MPNNDIIVVRNTYPRWPNVKSAETGDVVKWEAYHQKWLLMRKSDGATVFSRDAKPKHEEDTRPMIGVIASVASKGWFLEVRQNDK